MQCIIRGCDAIQYDVKQCVTMQLNVTSTITPCPIHHLKQQHNTTESQQEQVLQFKVPGGPKSSTPFGGDLSPVKRSGLRLGRMTASCRVCFAYARPAMSSHPTPGVASIISMCGVVCSVYVLREHFLGFDQRVEMAAR